MDVIVPRHQVAQLVGAPQLDPAAVDLVQVVEVVSLEHLVGELSETHPVVAPHPGLDAVSAQHGPHPEVSPSLREKPHHVPVLVPAQVVEDGHGAQVPAALLEEEQLMVGEDPLQTLPDAAGVLRRSLLAHPLSVARFPAGVSDLSRGASEHRQDVVAGAAEVQQADDGQQVAHMEAVCGGVEAAVDGLSTGLEQPGEPVLSCVLRERVLHEAAFIEREEEAAGCRRRTVEVRP